MAERRKKPGSAELADYTRVGMQKLAEEWRLNFCGKMEDKDMTLNNPYQAKYREKVKKKQISVGASRSAKEDRELIENIVKEVDTEWEELNRGATGSPALRSMRKKGQDRWIRWRRYRQERQ